MPNSSPNRFSSAIKPGTQRSWQNGDIAFLKSCDIFSSKDYNNLIKSGYLHEKATCYPVIILQAHFDRAIITPVTAFGSGAENNFQPPWQQIYHRRKCLDDFRAFAGTRRPNNNHAVLTLADPQMKMPKPRASWVYLRHFWTVPFSVLGRFNKTPGLLQVAKDSLAQLRQDIKQRCDSQLRDALNRLSASTAVAHAPAPQNPPKVAAMPVPAPQGTAVRSGMTYSKVVSGFAGNCVTQAISPAGYCGDRQIKNNMGPVLMT